jgi:xanthine dehydrogenase YagR molybdenum-binding subunit
MQHIQPNGLIGSNPLRIDGLSKVTGRALYGADQPAPNAAHAVLVTSPIARGRITSIDDSAARQVPGVCEILTHRNAAKAIKPNKTMVDGGYMAQSWTPLATPEIHFSGQIIAVVIADSAEIADQAAELLRFTFAADAASATLDSPGNKRVKAVALGETELSAGDIEAGFAAASAIIDACYETPPQHHNPMELFQCTCVWSDDGDELTVYESTQNTRGFQHGIAAQLGIKPAKVRVISPFIGGAFGSRGELGQNTALVALAARRLGRPVKHVATREEGFTLRTFRAETRHHLRLGADAEGHLTALSHDSWELTSRDDTFAVAGSDSTSRLYACPNVRTCVTNIEADRQTPGFMRAPPEMPYLFAMESAMDELAHKLGLDPVELRRRNETSVETVTGKPYTSRSLLQCMDRGAELFGWSRRNPEIGSHSNLTEHIGWGYATAFYPTQMGPAQCTVTLTVVGDAVHARVEVGTHEIGTGIRTVVAMTAADLLGLPLTAVEVVIGDSALPAAPLSAGSNSTATICSVVAIACENLRHRLARSASDSISGPPSPLAGVRNEAIRLRDGHLVAGEILEPLAQAVRRAGRRKPLVEKAANTPHGLPPILGNALVRKGKPIIMGGSNMKDRMQFAFGAHFVEVRIDRFTQQIRVPRMVGVFAAGRIMNTRTAWAQLNGGQIWGISSALHEASEVDRRYARYVNQNLAEYHVPVAADIGDIQTLMLPEEDTLVNPLGIKGVGELGVTGVNAAIANAMFHATGKRLRKLPIRPGDL